MVTGSKADMLPTLRNDPRGSNGSLEDSLQSELELMLQQQRDQQITGRERDRGRGRDQNTYRSGSAPPTVEGSLSAVGSLFRNHGCRDVNNTGGGIPSGVLSEEEIRSHPAYLTYYYSHENVNPRLPPPLLSKEDWRVAQRFQAGGGYGGDVDWKKKTVVDNGDCSTLFSMQLALSGQKAEDELMELRKENGRIIWRQTSSEWPEKVSDLTGLSGAGLGTRRKSFADILQEGLDRPTSSLSGSMSRPTSLNAYGDTLDKAGISDIYPAGLCNGAESTEAFNSGATQHRLVRVQSHGSSAMGSSLSRSATPEAQLAGRSTGCGLPPVGSRVNTVEKKSVIGTHIQNGHSSGTTESDVAASLSALRLSNVRHVDGESHGRSQRQVDFDNQPDLLFNMPNGHNQSFQRQLIDKVNVENLSASTNYMELARRNGIAADMLASKISLNGQVNFPRRTNSSASLYPKGSYSGFGRSEGSNVGYRDPNTPIMDFAGPVRGGCPVNPKLNSVVDNHLDAGLSLGLAGSRDRQGLNRLGNQAGPNVHTPVLDPRYTQQYLCRSDFATRAAAGASDPSQVKDYFSAAHGDLEGLQRAYLEALLAQQRQRYELQQLAKPGGINHGYYGNQLYGLGMSYNGAPVSSSLYPSVGSGSPMFQNDQMALFTSMLRNSIPGPTGSWHSGIRTDKEARFSSSLLDEFKNNKTRAFELSDIADHVVEFSKDQYGSRFIQQKLESATAEEKTKIFSEIKPHARTLMTDVFGNYVIQKLFEHGLEGQRKELANQLTGHVLPLSLQMYGCRVIQKALEVVGVDEQTEMVAELNGSVRKCVRDQNGNHVIQKCIECAPQDRIQFIITSFFGQVVALSTHPYGCRVIQRVLEHCDDSNTQQTIMDEIMQSVCSLAQDQYGNYVIQHVLEKGKPHERSAIITKLAGKIVEMSQQKFASNVVEKCLTFGSPEERQLLVNEMLGSTDENEPLQAMMKDPYGNYVVQKILETCDDNNLELILSRIKVHLNALKRYTYGKHIVSRVEKLITAGERRIGLSSSRSS